MSARIWLPRLKRSYVAAMRTTGAGLRRAGMLDGTAPPVEQRWRHWAFSLTHVHDSLAMAGMDVPWWTYKAIAEVDGWIGRRERPVRVFEYGSGASTLWLARRAAEVHSVEHDRGFGEMLAAELSDLTNVDFRIIEPEPSLNPRTPSRKEGNEGLDFTRYVESISEVAGVFDLVVVDGRARESCLALAALRLAPDGLLVFDNSRRRRYREAIVASRLHEERRRGLTPTLPYPDQTSLLTRAGGSSRSR